MIRKAKYEDIDILAKMAYQIWDNDSISELRKEFEELLQSDDNISFINFDKDEAIGFANASLRYDYVEGTSTSPVGYLEGIYVKNNYRHRGVARKLVETCEMWAKSMGCLEFASDCELDNKMSFDFHKRLGFIEANRIICFKKDLN